LETSFPSFVHSFIHFTHTLHWNSFQCFFSLCGINLYPISSPLQSDYIWLRYKLWSCLLCSFLSSPVTSFLLSPNIHNWLFIYPQTEPIFIYYKLWNRCKANPGGFYLPILGYLIIVTQ
jgi:hypothetical protein